MFSCAFKNYLGFDCPGCGTQRSIIALLKGDFIQSFYLNPALIPFLITLIYTFLHLFFNFKTGSRNILLFFYLTVFIMIVNFVIKLFLRT